MLLRIACLLQRRFQSIFLLLAIFIFCDLYKIRYKKKKLAKKLVALMKLASPTTFELFWCIKVQEYGRIFNRYPATISELTDLKDLTSSTRCSTRCNISDGLFEHLCHMTCLDRVKNRVLQKEVQKYVIKLWHHEEEKFCCGFLI